MKLRRSTCCLLLGVFVQTGASAVPGKDNDWATCTGDDPDKALEACTAVIATVPAEERALAYLDRSLAWRAISLRLRTLTDHPQGSPQAAATEASADLEQALRHRPDFAEALTNRAVLRYEIGAWPLAIEDASRAIALEPSLSEAWNIRALARLKTGAMVDATTDFDQTIRLEKNYGNALIARVVGPFVPDGKGGFVRAKPGPYLEP